MRNIGGEKVPLVKGGGVHTITETQVRTFL